MEKLLGESGLFKTVGLSQYEKLFPDLITHVTGHLPILFSEQDLREQVGPLLSSENVRRTLTNTLSTLSGLEGIGQASLIARDPLDLRNIVLKRLSLLGSSQNVVMVKGQLLSADRKHLLIIAEPVTSGYDTAFSQKVTDLIANITRRLNRQFSRHDSFILTPVGAYRAALDNETAAKKDTRRAILVSTVVIALLLLLGFPRPWIGLLALLPAFGGTIAALFVYSLFQKSISILAVGFGGAIISFTVDYGIAYLLFLDRPYETSGIEVTREVWSLGLLAMLTTAISFAFLFLAGFPALSQLGVFAALGVFFTYIFVHAVYPFLFPKVFPAKRHGILPLQRLADRLARGGKKTVWAAGLFGMVMLFFARPDFRVDLQSLNTVSIPTQAAERLIQGVWGDVVHRVFLAVEGKTIAELQGKEDRLADFLEAETAKGTVAPTFLPPPFSRGTTGQSEISRPGGLLDKRAPYSAAAGDGSIAPKWVLPRRPLTLSWPPLKPKSVPCPAIPPAFFPLLGIDKKEGKTGPITLRSNPARPIKGPSFTKALAYQGPGQGLSIPSCSAIVWGRSS